MYEIKTVVSKADWKLFLELPWTIYKGDPMWVPPLQIAVKDSLDTTKNPFFKHASMHPMIAMKDGKCVGRIVGVIDDAHN
jgi:hypothetical protein